ncbi:mitotic checkpoint serine/threonine-protein kinase BUB1 beta [Aulostomus maculatus]
MAEGGDVEWELSKENIQPLRRGRAMSGLHQALSQRQDGLSSVVIQQRQAFESELRMYEGDDPLDVWDRYIKWTQQTFPQGGKESSLTTLLERVVTRFTEETRYHNDPRYVDFWIKFAGNCPDPMDIYRYMQGQGIGTTQAAFYIAWSEEYENLGNCLKADRVYQEGFKKCAEPHDKLLQFHKALQARVSRQVMMSVEKDDDSDDEPKQAERVSLADLKQRGKKKAIAPVNRTGPAIRSISGGLQSHGAPAPFGASNSQLVIFDESKTPSAGPSEPRLESWVAPPSSRAKENEQRPEKWCDVKIPQKSKFGHPMMPPPPSKPTFQPFVEESDQPPTMTPCKINPAVNTVLSARKPCRDETPLKKLQEHRQQQKEADSGKQEQSMYCKELLLSGVTEFSFEELRAERYFKKFSRESQEVSGPKEPANATAAN